MEHAVVCTSEVPPGFNFPGKSHSKQLVQAAEECCSPTVQKDSDAFTLLKKSFCVAQGGPVTSTWQQRLRGALSGGQAP